jgi:hypothetical protein
VFLLSTTKFNHSNIQTYINKIINDSSITSLESPVVIDTDEEGTPTTALVMGQGFVGRTDYELTIPTPFKNIQPEIAAGQDFGTLTEVFMANSFVDFFLEDSVVKVPSHKSILNKLDWSTNVVRVGARNAFLEGALYYRAWCVLNVNWESDAQLDTHGANIDSVDFVDYAGNYQVRRAWSTGGKNPETKYNFTTIQATRRARRFSFRNPLPSDLYEVICFFTEDPVWRPGQKLPIYGGTAASIPSVYVTDKSTTSFTLQDTSLGGFGQGQMPRKGHFFIGVLLGTYKKTPQAGFGQANADATFDYNFDTWNHTKTTEQGHFDLD